jgi:hypothetical protein
LSSESLPLGSFVRNASYSEADVSGGGGSASSRRTKRAPLRMAARRSSSSRGSGPAPHWRIKSRIPSGIDSRLTSCTELGAPCLFPVGRALPRTARSPAPMAESWAGAAQRSSFRGEDHSFKGCSTPAKRKCTERWLPRPATRLTFAEAIATRGAINLRSSVLGAVGTLRDLVDLSRSGRPRVGGMPYLARKARPPQWTDFLTFGRDLVWGMR